MPILPWVTVLWPGLPRLWLRGEWSALSLACGFAALLNLDVIATWGWTELLSPPLLLLAWAGTVLFWFVSLVASIMQMPAFLRVRSADLTADLFGAAQREYLKGNWFEAELRLNQLVERNPNDVDAHLMLVALLRRIGHRDEARERLRRLGMLEAAGKWQFEITREWTLLGPATETTAQDVQLHEAGDSGLPRAA